MNTASVVITHTRVGFEVTQSPYVTHAPVVTAVHSLVHLARVGRYYSSDVAISIESWIRTFCSHLSRKSTQHRYQSLLGYLWFRLLLTEKKQTHKP